MASFVNSLLGMKKTSPNPPSPEQNLTVTGKQSQTSDAGEVGATTSSAAADSYAVIASTTPQIAVINLDLRGFLPRITYPY